VGNQWRMALVGCQRGSSYGNLAYRDPRVEVVALCDSDPQALARCQEKLLLPDSSCFASYDDLIASGLKLDAVIVGTPIPVHAEQVVKALDAGLHVMSEVTASNTIEGCAQIVAAARRTDRIYMLAENTIYRPLFAEWAKLVKSGRLGEIFYAEADYLHPIPELLVNADTGERRWRADRPPVHYCSHSLGPVLFLTEDRVKRAMAVGTSHRVLPDVGVGAVDVQTALFETERGMLIKMTRTQVGPRDGCFHYYSLFGTNGYVETDRSSLFGEPVQGGLVYIKSEMQHHKKVEWPEIDKSLPDWAKLGGHGTSDYSTFLEFCKTLDTGQKPVLDEIRAWDFTVPGLIAAESAAQGGKWLDVPPPPVPDRGADVGEVPEDVEVARSNPQW